MDENLLEALKNEIQKRIDSLNNDKSQLESELSNESNLQENELNEFKSDLKKVDNEIEAVNNEIKNIEELKQRREELKTVLDEKRLETEKRESSLLKDKFELEQELSKGNKLQDVEINEFNRDLEKINNELTTISSEKNAIKELDKEILEIDNIMDNYFKKYKIDKEEIISENSKNNSLDQDKKEINDETINSPALKRYNSEGYGKNANGEYFNPWIDDYDPEYDPEKDNYYNQEYNGKVNQDNKINSEERTTQENNEEKQNENTNKDNKNKETQKDVQARSNEFIKLRNKLQSNEKDIEKINNIAQKYKDNPDKLKDLYILQQNLKSENEELSKKIENMNKNKIIIPKTTNLEPKKMEIVPLEEKDKVFFNIRTGTYTYIDKNKNILVIKANQKNGSSLEEIMNKTSLSKKEAKKVDINLYNILKQIDDKNNTKKADEYLKAFTQKDKSKMPVELTYDIRKKGNNDEKEKPVQKLSVLEKIRVKASAKYHEKLGIAKALQDRSLFKKFILGLGIGAAATTLALGTAERNNTIDKPIVPQEQGMLDNSKDENNELDNTDRNDISEELIEQKVMEAITKFGESKSVLVKGGQEYIEASDLTQAGKRGKFAENMQCKIANRAIVEILPDGSEKIVATTKGKSWEEAGINLDDYKADNFIEKYALEAEDGEKDSRGYSVFGWVNADNCEKLYERKQEINGQEYTICYTINDIREMVKDEIKENGVSLQDRMKVNVKNLNTKTDDRNQETQQRDVEEMSK